jgi:hypothetical protein
MQRNSGISRNARAIGIPTRMQSGLPSSPPCGFLRPIKAVLVRRFELLATVEVMTWVEILHYLLQMTFQHPRGLT